MGLHVTLEGHDHPKSGVVAVKVTALGQLVAGPFDYDEVSAITLDVANTAVNIFGPLVQKRFVVTAILLTANKNVTTDCSVEIYESDGPTSTTVDKSILNIEMLKNSDRDITGLNFRLTEGVYLNGKTDDDDVFVTVMGYYVPTT